MHAALSILFVLSMPALNSYPVGYVHQFSRGVTVSLEFPYGVLLF